MGEWSDWCAQKDLIKLGVPGSMSKANPGHEVTVVEPGTDLLLPPNTPGKIVVDQKIPNIIVCGDYASPEKPAGDFRNLKFHTGDLGRIPYFMVPRDIRVVDSLPKTPTERVQKVKLREARRASRPTPSTVRPPVSRSSESGRVPR